MHTRSLVFRALIIALFLAVLFGLGLTARLLAQFESTPVLRTSHVTVLFYPLVALPLLHAP